MWILKKFNGIKQSAHLHNSINVHDNQSTFMQHLLTTHARKKCKQCPGWRWTENTSAISQYPNQISRKSWKKCTSTESNRHFFFQHMHSNALIMIHPSRAQQDSPLRETTGKKLMSIHCVWTTDWLTFIYATSTHLKQRMTLLHSTCQSPDVCLSLAHFDIMKAIRLLE